MKATSDDRTPDKPKRIGLLLLSLLFLAPPLQGEMITLAGSGCTLELQVQEISEDRLTGHMKRADIVRLRMGVSADEAFSDRLLSRRCEAEFKVKLLAMSEESATLVLPREIITIIEVGAGQEAVTGANTVIEAGAGQEATTGANIDPTTLDARAKDRLARRQMALYKKQAKAAVEKERFFETGIDKDLFGSLSGRLLVGGKPYKDARVIVRRLPTESEKGDTKITSQTFDAVTDSRGIYRFGQLPEGPYDIYWIPPGTSYWVRQLTKEPATVIRTGEQQRQNDINADMVVAK